MCGVKRQKVVVINRIVLINSANYKMTVHDVSRAAWLASYIFSRGNSVYSLLFICQAG